MDILSIVGVVLASDRDHRRRHIEGQQCRRSGRLGGVRHRGAGNPRGKPGADADGDLPARVENRLVGVHAASEQSESDDRQDRGVEQYRS
jgi:hypothetical protein